VVFEPTGWGFLGLLVVGFGGLVWGLTRTKLLAVKITAAVVAFGLASLFGASLVNASYQYYTSWGALVADMRGSGTVGYDAAMASRTSGAPTREAPSLPPVSAPAAPTITAAADAAVPASVSIPRLDLAAEPTTGSGRVVWMALPGARSGISRRGYVYLPPQYFQPGFAAIRFPVLELLHGDPGDPSGWVYGLSLAKVMDAEIDAGRVGPMVVVMPSTFNGSHGQDCVDNPIGQLDDTYLAVDVPADVTSDFRVLAPGPHWGVGGLSDGGFCAANLALRHPGSFAAVASLDGFYTPQADLATLRKILGTDAALSAYDPTAEVQDARRTLPRFWIMSGTGNSIDMLAAKYFTAAVTVREPIANVVVHGGKHTPPAWRIALPYLLRWAWNTESGGPVGVGTTNLTVAPEPRNSPSAPPSTAASTSSTSATPRTSAPPPTASPTR
jgi:enterochelin esterase-like enzyme